MVRRDDEAFEEMRQVDHDLFDALAHSDTPSIDRALSSLSNAANYSRLWLAIAGGLALSGQKGRRAASRGVLSVAIASLSANLVFKPVMNRDRPQRRPEHPRHADGRVRVPTSTSFPSGHSASAFAFAGAVGREMPAISLPMHLLAGSVAYSRIHTGVHYPSDVAIGSFIGMAAVDVAPWVQSAAVAVVSRVRTAFDQP